MKVVDNQKVIKRSGSSLNEGYSNYTEVNISSAQILNLGAVSVILLPAPGVNTYYEYKIVLEYTFVTSYYTTAGTDDLMIGGSNYTGIKLIRYLIENAGAGNNNNVAIVTSDTSAIEDGYNAGFQVGYASAVNSDIILGMFASTNPIGGDGTIKAKIWYNIVSFG